MSGKVSLTLDDINKAGVANLITAYNMGFSDAENAGRVHELETKVRDYRREVCGLNMRIGRTEAQHDAKMGRVRELVASLREEINNAPGKSATAREASFFAFFAALEKEVAK